MLIMWPCNSVFLTSKISYLFIPNITHNTETATLQKVGNYS